MELKAGIYGMIGNTPLTEEDHSDAHSKSTGSCHK